MNVSKQYIGYVDRKYLQDLAQRMKLIKQRSYELMHLSAGYKVLDVGCGPGIDTIPLAQWVGSTGQVIGVDVDKEMIAQANQKAEEAGVAEWVIHEQVDANSLPYSSGTFDACHSERLFQHLDDPVPVLSEMVRVTKSSGWIVVVDTDHSSMSVDTSEIEIEWRLRRFRSENIRNGYAGRQLYRLLKQQKLTDVYVELFPYYMTDDQMRRSYGTLEKAVESGVITPEEYQRWRSSEKQALAEGVFFAMGLMVMVAGRKP